jgi:3-hydroxyisobutyrate dehydrogenase-like beta-hydroxyacid dehydrogenase
MIGVIGVGRMGSALLPHLAGDGDVGAFDVDPARRIVVESAGARWFPDLDGLARSADVLLTALPGPGELDSVASEALEVMRADTLWIDLTSGDPRVTRRLAERAAARGIACVSAAMGGSVDEASRADLTLYVGGDAASVARARPLLERLAATDGIRLAGSRPEDAQVVKLLANALWFAHAVAAGEALLLGQSLGLDPERLHELLRDSAGGSRFMSRDLGRLLDGDVMATFGIDRVVEELDTVAALGRDADTPTPVLDASADVHRAAFHRFGPMLGELLGVRLLEERAGRVLRRSSPGSPD